MGDVSVLRRLEALVRVSEVASIILSNRLFESTDGRGRLLLEIAFGLEDGRCTDGEKLQVALRVS